MIFFLLISFRFLIRGGHATPPLVFFFHPRYFIVISVTDCPKSVGKTVLQGRTRTEKVSTPEDRRGRGVYIFFSIEIGLHIRKSSIPRRVLDFECR